MSRLRITFESNISIPCPVSNLSTFDVFYFSPCFKFQLLDVSELTIDDVNVLTDGGRIPVNHFVSDLVKDIGSKLTIELPTKTSGELKISIKYETSPKASGLQWLTPENTLGKQHPYLFSQFQSIHARSVVPCQDSPAVKFTFNAEVTHPPELTVLLSGVRLSSENGKTIYEQTVPIPAYLLSIACGAIVSRPLGKMCVLTSFLFF